MVQFSLQKALVATGLLALASANAFGKCKEVSFTLNATATNKNITGIDTTSVLALVNGFVNAADIVISGPQKIAGTFCTPLYKNGNRQKLQVLFHSITANRGSWQGLGGLGTDFPEYQPGNYSYVQFANALGYPVLSLDRLGNGRSAHPDPVLVVQAPYEMALYANLAQQLRAGSAALDQKYNTLLYVGNSYGSQLGAGIAGLYPAAYDQYVLTGFSDQPDVDFVGVSLGLPAPAAVVDPARFGTLAPAYVTTSSQVGRTNAFFGSHAQVDYSDKVAALFFKRKDTVSLGQFVSVYAYPFNGGNFTGRVLTLNGEQDQAFCGPGSPVLGPASCGPIPKRTGALFPQADYNYKTVDKVGHAVQNHYRSLVLFAIAHEFLAGTEFRGGAPA